MTKRKLVIEHEHGMYRIHTADYDVRSTTLDGALEGAMERASVPLGVISSDHDAAEVLDSLMGRQEGS